jgi:hypothetical protein
VSGFLLSWPLWFYRRCRRRRNVLHYKATKKYGTDLSKTNQAYREVGSLLCCAAPVAALTGACAAHQAFTSGAIDAGTVETDPAGEAAQAQKPQSAGGLSAGNGAKQPTRRNQKPRQVSALDVERRKYQRERGQVRGDSYRCRVRRSPAHGVWVVLCSCRSSE